MNYSVCSVHGSFSLRTSSRHRFAFYNLSCTNQELKSRGLITDKWEDLTRCATDHDEAIRIVALMKAHAKHKDLHKGATLHAHILRSGLIESNSHVANTLISLYAKCGALEKAQELLDQIPVRDVVSWNALISGYDLQGQSEKALHCFEWMQIEGLSPNTVTFTCALKACSSIKALVKGEQIHDEIVKLEMLEKEVVLGSALVEMYVKCGVLGKAQQVLNKLPVRDAFTWNFIIAGYAEQGRGKEALNCLEWMQKDSLSPNAVTCTCIFKACCHIDIASIGENFYYEALMRGWIGNDLMTETAAMDMFVKFDDLKSALWVFEKLSKRDVVTWNTLIAGYAQQGNSKQVLDCMEQMQYEGISPDAFTFSYAVGAVASTGASDKGEQIHDQLVRQKLLEKNVVLGTSLVDMYVKFGALANAQGVLDGLPVRDAVSWNALIAGHAKQGQGQKALCCLARMQEEGLFPGPATLAVMLHLCSHTGLLREGQLLFAEMETKYAVTPDIEHFCCMIDLFGRVGEFDKALAVMEKMSSCDYISVWHSLAGACQKWGKLNLGRWAFEHILQVGRTDASAYVCMANIYAVEC